jgi:hypothetical protein
MLYGIIPLAAGLALLLVAELAGVAALRIIAAVLLVGGAIGGGMAADLSPHSQRLLNRICGMFPRIAVCTLAMILMVPVLTVITTSLVRVTTLLVNLSSVTNISLVIVGGIIGLLLLTAMLMVIVTGIGAIRGKTLPQSAKEQA